MSSKEIGAYWTYGNHPEVSVLHSLSDQLDVIRLEYGDDPPSSDLLEEWGSFGLNIHRSVFLSDADLSRALRNNEIDLWSTDCCDQTFSGIDLTLSLNRCPDIEGVISLLRSTSKRFRDAGKLISIGLDGMGRHTACEDGSIFDVSELEQLFDEFRVVCHGQYGPPFTTSERTEGGIVQGIGPTSSQPWAAETLDYWMRHIPGSKITMELPSYSVVYDARSGGGGELVDSLASPFFDVSFDRTWLWFDRIHLYRYCDSRGVPMLLYASDAESTQALLETADNKSINKITFRPGSSVSSEMWDVASRWRDADLAKHVPVPKGQD